MFRNSARQRSLARANPYVWSSLRCYASNSSFDSLFANGPLLTLERAVNARQGVDKELWSSGAFKAQVYPDLPLVSSLSEWWAGMMGSSTAAGAKDKTQQAAHNGVTLAWQSQPDTELGFTVQTVAAQCRSIDEVTRRLIVASGADGPEGSGADAVLVVSGSHPLRRVPGAQLVLPSSFTVLKLASKMRDSGSLPRTLSLWAVENPNIAPVDRLQRKVDAGAEVILTQPPFLSSKFQSWFEDMTQQGLANAVKVVAGIPMITSVKNLEFWLTLCDISKEDPEAKELLASFPKLDPSDSQAYFAEAVKEWNSDFVRKTLDLPGVSGLHVMPLTGPARKLTSQFIQQGVLPTDPSTATHDQLPVDG